MASLLRVGLSAGGADGGFGALNFGGLDGSGSPLFPHSESGHDLAGQVRDTELLPHPSHAHEQGVLEHS